MSVQVGPEYAGGGAVNKLHKNCFVLSDYFISRFSRIYTVLVPALLLGGVLDFVGIMFFNGSEIYTNADKYDIGTRFESNLNWTTFIGNIMNMQGILVYRFGSNLPLWSLANEWWYYIMFGLLVEAYKSRYTVWRSAGVYIFVIFCLWGFPLKITLWFSIWLIGALTAVIDFKNIKIPAWGAFIFLIAGLVISKLCQKNIDSSNIYVELLRDLFLAGVFCVSLLCLKTSNFTLAWKSTHNWLADFSFSLYVIHFPLMVFLVAILHDVHGVIFYVEPNAWSFVEMLFLVVMVYMVAWGFAKATESHYHSAGNIMREILMRYKRVK